MTVLGSTRSALRGAQERCRRPRRHGERSELRAYPQKGAARLDGGRWAGQGAGPTIHFLFVLCLSLIPAAASSSVSIALSPQVVEKIVTPGSTIADVISYTNLGSEATSVSLELSDFTATEQGQAVEHPPTTQPSSLVPYLKISPLRQNVAPNERVYFRYTVQTPQSFTHLRAMVLFVSRPVQRSREKSSAVIVPRMGVPLYVESSRARAASLEVEHVEWDRKPREVLLRVTVRNRGQRVFRPGGTVQVESRRVPAQTIPFNDGAAPVMPDHKRTFTIPMTEVGGGELALKLRINTSPLTVFEREYKIESASSPRLSR